MKRMLSLALALTMCLALSVPASAASSGDQVITFEQYYEAVRDEYAKYGVGYEVIEKNEGFVFTQKILDDRLAEIRNTMENNTPLCNADCNSYTDTVLDRSVEGGSDFSAADIRVADGTRAMPYQRTLQYTTTLSDDVIGWADICMEIVVMEDAQISHLMSVVSYRTFQKGTYMNFASWNQKSMTVSPDYLNDKVTGTATGLLTLEYTEPTTGLIVGNTTEHTITHTFTL